jgi:hypothetical protein
MKPGDIFLNAGNELVMILEYNHDVVLLYNININWIHRMTDEMLLSYLFKNIYTMVTE